VDRRGRRAARVLKTVAAATACAVVALVGPAAAHERHGVAKGYVSTVSAIQPNVLGLSAFVVGGDDRLLLRNLSPRVIVIRGYDGEPYLRFSPDGVYENVRSPATYLNRFRFPRGDPPASADPTASPEWRRITTANNTSWHDHRIHWMRGEPPPVVAAAPRRSHRIFDWRVPGTADGKPFAVTGFLGYSPASPAATAAAPSDDGDASWAIPVAVAGGGLALLALLYRLRRKA
jgi:hypothetical protein